MAAQARANEVTIEDIERALSAVASNCIFSSPEIRLSALTGVGFSPEKVLGPLYLRLQAREAKWLTRLILKTYAPVILSETLVYKSYHYLLPDLLKIQDNLPASLQLLPEIDRQNSRSDNLRKSPKNRDILSYLRPVVGVKVGRQPFYKARSIKHCISMAQNRRMSIEKKYDGEYCQIHINMTAPLIKQITIFSKSGRNSTEDRVKVHKYVGNICASISL
jgi:DNA ligase-4